MLRFRDLGASFSSLGCFVFDFWVLRFRDLGASFSRFGCFVFEIWVLRASVFVFVPTNTKVDRGQIRSEEIAYSRFITIPLG